MERNKRRKELNMNADEMKKEEICRYCHEDYDGYYKPLDKNAHFTVFDNAHEKILDINWYGHKMKIPINYCPMCGRRLNIERR